MFNFEQVQINEHKPYFNFTHVGYRGQPLIPSLPPSLPSKKEEAILMTIKAASEHAATRQSSPGKVAITCDVCNSLEFMTLMMSLNQRQREIQKSLSPSNRRPIFERHT